MHKKIKVQISSSVKYGQTFAIKTIIIALLAIFLTGCQNKGWQDIPGFSKAANQKLQNFFQKYKNYQGRKVAAFDGDGTVLGQVPHYLADECLYQEAVQKPNYKKDIVAKMTKMSNVSIPYVQHRIFYLSGKTLQQVRDMGNACFKKDYSDKIFQPMKHLIQRLKKNGFEIWIVTASPEALYQKFLSKAFDIPITNIVGVKSAISNGIVTNRIVHPIPQDHGKKEAIETFIQEQPLLVGGNSRGDKEMIEFSRDLKLIVNPDEHIAHDQKESIATYAKKNGWLIVRIKDVARKDFPSISSKKFKMRLNKERK